MKQILLLFLALASVSIAQAQAYTTAMGPDGRLVFSDTTDARYAKVYYYDTTGVFTIPKGAHSVSIYNSGGSDGEVQTDTATGLRSLPTGAPALNLGALEFIGTRRYPYIVLPSIQCDATGTRFLVIEYR